MSEPDLSVPEIIYLGIPAEEFNEALVAAIKSSMNHGKLRELIDAAVERHLTLVVGNMVREEVSDSERFTAIRAEVYKQLTRWPALASDETMKQKVSAAILECFMKPGS